MPARRGTEYQPRDRPLSIALALLVIVLGVGAPAGATTPARAALPAKKEKRVPAQVVTVPELDVRAWTLANGLQVLFLADHRAPVATVQVFYHVGSKDERVGIRGVAHMFEHMMFKGSARVAPEEHARLLRSLGGDSNAFTTEDVTGYHETVPPSAVGFALELEAERMRDLRLTPETVASERKVVEEEKRLTIDNNPVGQVLERFRALAYTEHPYRWTALGTIEDLEAVTPSDCQTFYDRFYRPNNATLVVVGDLEEATVRAQVERAFGGLAPGPAVTRTAVVEPPQTKLRRDTLRLDVQVPIVVGGFHVGRARDPDAAVLDVLSAVLSQGESARLTSRLVRKERVAVEAGVVHEALEEPGLFAIYAAFLPDREPEAVEAALRRELASVRREGVTEAELARAKNQLLVEHLQGLRSVEGIATALGTATYVDGSWREVREALVRISRVTVADVKRVAVASLRDENFSVLYLLPSAQPTSRSTVDAVAPASASPAALQSTSRAATTAGPAARPAGAALVPPAAVSAAPLPVPPVTRFVLPNGLRLEVLVRKDLPLARAVLSLPLGGYDERRERLGVATLTAAMLTKGTVRRSADELAALIEDRGGELDAASEQDTTSVACQGFAADTALCLDLLADVTLHPSFPAKELGAVKDRLVAALEQRRDEPGELARAHFENLIYGERHPDGWVLEPEHVLALERRDLQAFWKQAGPRGATLAVSGDVDPEEVHALVTRLFSGWRGPAASLTRSARQGWSLPTARATHVWLIDKPDLTQATFHLGHLGIRKKDPDLYALTLVNDVLGGGDFSSRLMREIRVARSLTYGIGSSVEAGPYDGHFAVAASSRNETVVEALRETIAQLARMRDTGPTAEELVHAQSYWAGSYPFSLESPDALLEALVAAEHDGLDPDFVRDLPVRMSHVGLTDAAAAARRHFDPEHLTIVIVGKGDVVAPALAAAHLPFTRVSVEEPISAGARAEAVSKSSPAR